MRPIPFFQQPFVFLLIVLFALPQAYGQDTWDLEACISFAIEKNISVKRMDLQAERTQNQLKTAQAARYPSVSGWATHNLSSGKTVNYEDYSYINTEYQDGNIGVQGSLDVFTGLSIYNTVKAQQWAFQAALEESEQLRNSIILQVTSAYLQLVFAHELSIVSQEQYQMSLQQIDQTAVFVEQGTMAKANLLEMKAQAARDQYNLVQARNQLANARLNLIQLMNYPDEDSIQFSFDIPAISTEYDLNQSDHIFEKALSELPQIKGAQFRQKSSEYMLASARGNLSPNININGVYYSRYSELGVDPLDPSGLYTYSDQIADNSYGRISVSMNIPIFNKRQSRNQINLAKIDVLDSKYALEEAKLILRNDIERSANDAQNALSKYLAASQALESIELSHEYITAQFQSGLVTSIDYNLSKNQLVKTKSDLLQAKFEYLLRTKILDFYQGIPIEM